MFRLLIAGLLLLFSATSLATLIDTFHATGAGAFASLFVGLLFVGVPASLALRLLRGRRRLRRRLSRLGRRFSRLESPPPAPQPPRTDPKVELEVEVLKLARRLKGRLTAMEVVTELDVGVEKAEAVLNDLNDRGIAGQLISDSGLIVYSFRDLEYLDEKSSARPVLD